MQMVMPGARRRHQRAAGGSGWHPNVFKRLPPDSPQASLLVPEDCWLGISLTLSLMQLPLIRCGSDGLARGPVVPEVRMGGPSHGRALDY